ncbi:MAG: type V CRISPR-associated protein Cas4 [Candidatus Methanomethylophilaceae archaeon]|jgi:CRISPR-associated protein Cas4
MDNLIQISFINDFQFCPVSIYFHNLLDDSDRILFQSVYQINGTHVHKSIDEHQYSSKTEILQGISIYCEKYGIIGKIDIFDVKKGILTERKKKVSQLYIGQIFQVYAQCFSLEEMGYEVKKIRVHSIDDNKTFDVEHPKNSQVLFERFEKTIESMHDFDPSFFVQNNPKKCERCIYEPMCGSSCLEGENAF